MSQVPVTNVPGEGVPHHYQQHSESSTPLTSTSPVNSGDHGALYTRLRNQVEFYFSPQNLARDTYLRNMLTAKHQEVPSPPPLQLVTPVAIITNFPKVRDICSAFEAALSDPPHVLLARACEGSTIVTVSADGAWIGPSSQQLPPLTAPTPRMAHPTPQAHFQQSPFPPSHHQPMMIPAAPMGEMQPMHFMGPPPVPVVQNVPLSRGSASPSSNSLDSMPSQAKETVVVVPDMPAECNPILLMTAFTTGNIRPISVSADGNTNTWHITFASDADAKAALSASSEKTVAGSPIRAKLKTEPASARVSVASASGASLSSMSASQRQQMQVPQMVQQPLPVPGAQMMYPPGAYPMPQPSPPPQMQHGMPPYPMGGYNMAPMPMPGQPFPPYPQMQPMYPYCYMPQHGHPHFPMNHPPMMGRFGPGVPPPPPRYPGPPYPYQHGHQHQMGDGPGQFHRQHQHPPRHHAGEERGPASSFNEGGQKNVDHGGSKKKKNRYQKQHSSGSLEGGGNQQSGSNHASRENTSSPNNFGRGRGRHSDNFRRSTGSAPPALSRHQRGNSNKFSKSDNLSEKQNENKEIFTATDFPGLSGDGNSQNTHHGDSSHGSKTKIFSGYADALRKKDAEKADRESNTTKETDVSAIDSITRQTEAMEREILSDFHDLTIRGDDGHHGADNNRNGDKDVGKTAQQAKPFEHLPILPGMSSLGQSLSLDEPDSSIALHHSTNYPETEEANAQQSEPVIADTDNNLSPADTHSHNVEEEKPASAGAWGTKRLFADVIKDK
ncbi:hypothetical protein ACHAWO_010400 [Cyclotella atomus]|uniref:HTH La-type RNA-binding domain-containing protein n=1 Tax=Cyclotella atomus TaxID=382360 RepID=A0ABD3MX40_9STRA